MSDFLNDVYTFMKDLSAMDIINVIGFIITLFTLWTTASVKKTLVERTSKDQYIKERNNNIEIIDTALNNIINLSPNHGDYQKTINKNYSNLYSCIKSIMTYYNHLDLKDKIEVIKLYFLIKNNNYIKIDKNKLEKLSINVQSILKKQVYYK